VGYTELYIWRTHTPVVELRRVYIYALSHRTSHSKIESNRPFLLKNHLKSIVHLKAGIITALIIIHKNVSLCTRMNEMHGYTELCSEVDIQSCSGHGETSQLSRQLQVSIKF